MDGSGNTLLSPVSIVPSPFSKFSPSPGGLDENEVCHDQTVFSNLKSSQTSSSSVKHYMSPTISAASKAAIPRKKILAERNGVPDVEQILFAKPFNLSPKMSSPKCSTNGPIKAKSCSFEPSIVDAKSSAKCSTNGVTDFQSSLADDSSLKRYDPLTNYLSPRPQFLRYNPNRRHKIFLHTENEGKERGPEFDAKTGLSFDTQKPAFEEALGEDTQGCSVSCSDEDSGMELDEKIDGENVEGDTQESSVFSSEEDNDGSSVISSEEDPVKKECEFFNENVEDYHLQEKAEEEEEDMEVFEEERGWSLKGVSQFLIVMVSLIFSTHYISSMNSAHLVDNTQGVWDLKSQYHNYHFNTGLNFSEGAVEPISLWGETEIGILKFGRGVDVDNFDEGFVIRDASKSLESIDKASDQVEVFEIEKVEEVSNEWEASEAAALYENEENSGLGFDDGNMESGDGIEPVEEVLDQLVEENVERVKETADNEFDELDTEKGESGPISPESDSMEFLLPKAKLDSIRDATFVVSIVFTILALLGVVCYLRHKKVRTEESRPVIEPLVEPVMAETITPLASTMEEEKSNGAAEISASTSPMVPEVHGEVSEYTRHSHSHSHSLSHSQYQSHGPAVELLGELVIGEVSSSLRSRAVRSRNSEKEEHSNVSLSQSQRRSLAETPEVSSHAKTTSLNVSAADSTLDGSSTAEEKKRGKGAEETPTRRSSKAPPSTPVRRSSRLKAMSP